ncbi:LexA family transcriptional regulator [Novosphingobium mangrovi (ex Huang et al. 2023)]|uniref:Peptidase S24/S26A/S26B/S26C domain-containing protein n=1 Tax=Novosphingobium mangrovi (ex Huang et al. 2023) TaxID=2976432 RepID=A0ABT2I123_9SPHN|nr:LexA family transcriptional regulator [Novosphingobium mangrovi (ex Huang et al. 2023)]MCT2398501.1 hypothetical protein [Novosphingobium mangrovi (ex Huang et al. 2023)]
MNADIDTGHIPHMSTGYNPLAEPAALRDNARVPTPKQILADRVGKLVAESGRSARDISIAATGKPDLVRDILRERRMPNGEALHDLARELGTTSDYLLGKATSANPVRSEVSIHAPPSALTERPGDIGGIPLLGTGYCDDLAIEDDDGSFEIERVMLELDHVVQMIRRPPALSNAPDAYAIYFHGSSMEPRYYQGEMAIVDPRRPPSPGDFVVVQLSNGEDHDIITVLVKQLVRVAKDYVELRQFNPDRTFSIDRRKVRRLHRIVSNNELYSA